MPLLETTHLYIFYKIYQIYHVRGIPNKKTDLQKNVENANALRTQVMIETVTKKILEMQMQSPKSITKLVKGRQEFAEDDCSNILTTSIITRRRFVVKSVAKDLHFQLCLTST